MGELEDRSNKLLRMQRRDTQNRRYDRDLERLRAWNVKI